MNTVYQVRIHGRGGQGVVTAAELLSVAAFEAGAHAQAFPSFGSERTGAPVAAYCRIDAAPIRSREPVLHPDAVIVQDSTLLRGIDVFGGLVDGGWALLNSGLDWDRLGLGRFGLRRDRVVLLPATRLATAHLDRPLPNAALLGGFAALSGGLVTLDGVTAAIARRFHGAVADGNIAAAWAAYTLVREAIEEVTRAQAD